MERTEATVQTTISFHQVLNALEQLSYEYPCERLAPAQIERIADAAHLLMKRLEEYREEKDKPTFTGKVLLG